MSRIEMEKILYDDQCPDCKADPDKLTFIQIDEKRCIGCDTCQTYCPTGAVFGKTGSPTPSPTGSCALTAGSVSPTAL